MRDAALEELLLAAKDGVLFLAEIMKAIKADPRESGILMRLNAAIKAVEFPTTPAARDGGRMEMPEGDDA